MVNRLKLSSTGVPQEAELPLNPFSLNHLSADYIKQLLCLTVFNILSALLHTTFEAALLYSISLAGSRSFVIFYVNVDVEPQQVFFNNSYKGKLSIYLQKVSRCNLFLY